MLLRIRKRIKKRSVVDGGGVAPDAVVQEQSWSGPLNYLVSFPTREVGAMTGKGK
jgi:hypothetical protein